MVGVGYYVFGLLIGAGLCWVLAPLWQGFVKGVSEARSDVSGGAVSSMAPLRNRSGA